MSIRKSCVDHIKKVARCGGHLTTLLGGDGYVSLPYFTRLWFFLISNFGVWISGNLYPLTFEGLISCYAAAIPFFRSTLASNLLFSYILFGGYYFLQKDVVAFQLKHIKYSKF